MSVFSLLKLVFGKYQLPKFRKELSSLCEQCRSKPMLGSIFYYKSNFKKLNPNILFIFILFKQSTKKYFHQFITLQLSNSHHHPISSSPHLHYTNLSFNTFISSLNCAALIKSSSFTASSISLVAFFIAFSICSLLIY